MGPRQPYISLVVTARNDDHGGNLLGRMQCFASGWITLAKRHHLASELIVVEWNPPADRQRLWQALHWPDNLGECKVRFIEVPGELHRRFQHADALPLYQMIAKNVGIRRARGQFILATNIDILFSDELVAFLARQELRSDRMYRIDRHDAMSDVPADADIDTQLEYCSTHLLRLNSREGTFPLTPDGHFSAVQGDIAEPESGIGFGKGWFPVERYSPNEPFRWADYNAELEVTVPETGERTLKIDLEPGPGRGEEPMTLHILEGGRLVESLPFDGRCELQIRLNLAPGSRRRVVFAVSGGGHPVEHDLRILNFRAFSCVWKKTPEPEPEPSHGSDAPSQVAEDETCNSPQVDAAPEELWSAVECVGVEPVQSSIRVTMEPENSWARIGRVLRQIAAAPERIANARRTVTFSIPVSTTLRRAAQIYVEWGGVVGLMRNSVIWMMRRIARRKSTRRGDEIFALESGVRGGTGWYAYETYRGEVFQWVQNDAEIILDSTSEKTTRLALQVEAGPGTDHKPFELIVRDQDGQIVARTTVQRSEYIRLVIPRLPGCTEVFTLGLHGGGRACSKDPRILNFRVFWCGLESPPTADSSRIPSLHLKPPKYELGAVSVRNEAELIISASEYEQPPIALVLNSPTEGIRMGVFGREGTPLAEFPVLPSERVPLNLPLQPRRTSVFRLRVSTEAGAGPDAVQFMVGLDHMPALERPAGPQNSAEQASECETASVAGRGGSEAQETAEGLSTADRQQEQPASVPEEPTPTVSQKDGEIRISERTQPESVSGEGGARLVELQSDAENILDRFRRPNALRSLHTNGCGDFTLAARERWLDLRAYPEFDLFSMNIDSIFCYSAHHGGAVEEVLPDPMRIYHIEHGTGSGWTPEGQEKLFARIAAKGLGFVSYADVVGWAAQMRRLNSTMIFNHDDWGLAGFNLKEVSPRSGRAETTTRPTAPVNGSLQNRHPELRAPAPRS